MDELARVQRYPFPVDAQGRQLRGGLQGPEYMRRQRTRVRRLGVRILDHTPALELLTDADGVVSGARVLDRPTGETVRIQAAAVVLAAGGCAFQSKTLGCDVNTGDGALLAVEAGARLSGMEFSNAYAIAPKGTSLTSDARLRPRRRRRSGDRATGQLPDLLPVRGVLPDRRAVRRPAGDRGRSGLALA